MPIICISGLTGSGKNAAGEALAKRLGLRMVSFSFKDDAKKHGMGLMDFQAIAAKHRELDLEFDRRLTDEAAKGNCVVTTWLGPWMVKNADLRVLVYANEVVRAQRVAKRDNMTSEQALAHIRKRDADNRDRYMRYYKIDIFNHNIFDLQIDSGEHLPGEIAEMIENAMKEKGKAKKRK